MRFTPRFSITNAIAAALTEIERARGFLDAASLSDEWIDSMRSRAFLLEAHHTTHIEGTRLTIEEAADLLAGDDVPGADPDDTRELLNYRDAFEFVSTYLNDGGPITERLILDIHRHLVSGVSGGSAAPGQYRRVQNYVVNSATGETIYTPPPVRDVPILMRELVSWLNRPGDIHPVIASGIAQFQLVHIHPFLDGNGRTSRLLSTLCLYRAGLRLQAAVHHQRILRPGPHGLLPGSPERTADEHGHDGLDRILRHRPCHPARRGQAARRVGDSAGHPRSPSRPDGSTGTRPSSCAAGDYLERGARFGLDAMVFQVTTCSLCL